MSDKLIFECQLEDGINTRIEIDVFNTEIELVMNSVMVILQAATYGKGTILKAMNDVIVMEEE